MRRKTANEEVERILKKAVDEIYQQQDNEFTVAQVIMNVAEDELVKTLDQNQLALYKEFCKKREYFYIKASKIYKRVGKK